MGIYSRISTLLKHRIRCGILGESLLKNSLCGGRQCVSRNGKEQGAQIFTLDFRISKDSFLKKKEEHKVTEHFSCWFSGLLQSIGKSVHALHRIAQAVFSVLFFSFHSVFRFMILVQPSRSSKDYSTFPTCAWAPFHTAHGLNMPSRSNCSRSCSPLQRAGPPHPPPLSSRPSSFPSSLYPSFTTAQMPPPGAPLWPCFLLPPPTLGPPMDLVCGPEEKEHQLAVRSPPLLESAVEGEEGGGEKLCRFVALVDPRWGLPRRMVGGGREGGREEG